jgi:CheY-like chemotaxis protein
MTTFNRLVILFANLRAGILGYARYFADRFDEWRWPQPSAAVAHPPITIEAPVPASSCGTVLIVDHHNVYRGVLACNLALRGFTPLTARSGADALAIAAESTLDGLLVEADLPDMTGFEFCRRFRAHRAIDDRDAPIWLMTAALRVRLEARGAKAGATAVVRKPLPMAQTCAELAQRIAQRRRIAAGAE